MGRGKSNTPLSQQAPRAVNHQGETTPTLAEEILLRIREEPPSPPPTPEEPRGRRRPWVEEDVEGEDELQPPRRRAGLNRIDDEDEEPLPQLLNQLYAEGALVWARLGRLPFHPAIIAADPQGNFYEKKVNVKGVACHMFRVAWFGGTGCYSWMGASELAPFQPPLAPLTNRAALTSLQEWLAAAKRFNGANKRASRLPKAGAQAESWMEGVEEAARLAAAKRFNGADKMASRLPKAGAQAASWMEGGEEAARLAPLGNEGRLQHLAALAAPLPDAEELDEPIPRPDRPLKAPPTEVGERESPVANNEDPQPSPLLPPEDEEEEEVDLTGPIINGMAIPQLLSRQD
ncbi:hypothetical protein LSTR_LSTR000367 [Laodelphax striatellus]|uniref:PWWP domain-containing protein n=1 Tax=Laodelphax striatellus TaxID=195883 RepID=A0A482X4P8_LAOST|nr:hypothetical protein LSTR_LSTR000367 [Laodelphax striatellus]